MFASTAPNITDFTTFLRSVVGIDLLYLPDNAPVIGYAFNTSMAIVNPLLACMPLPMPVPGSWTMYALAVYNLGADSVINFAPDQTNRTYFLELRQSFNINSFVPGVIAASSNAPTAQTTLNPEFMKTFTMRDLRNLRTPYGRAYLEIALDYGSLWGIS
jgi:hypothetical protein